MRDGMIMNGIRELAGLTVLTIRTDLDWIILIFLIAGFCISWRLDMRELYVTAVGVLCLIGTLLGIAGLWDPPNIVIGIGIFGTLLAWIFMVLKW